MIPQDIWDKWIAVRREDFLNNLEREIHELRHYRHPKPDPCGQLDSGQRSITCESQGQQGLSGGVPEDQKSPAYARGGAKVPSFRGSRKEAYAHKEYQDLILGLKEAVEEEEKLKWQMTAAMNKIEIWRTAESTKRAELRAI